MNDELDQIKVTIRLPKIMYATLNAQARDQYISLSQCIRDQLLSGMQSDKKMLKMLRASLYLIGEVLYYARLGACNTHPAWVSEANAAVDVMVKKLLEEE